MITINLLPPDMRTSHKQPKSLLFAIAGSALLILVSMGFFVGIHFVSLPAHRTALDKTKGDVKKLGYASKHHKELSTLTGNFAQFSKAIQDCKHRREFDFTSRIATFSRFMDSVMAHVPSPVYITVKNSKGDEGWIKGLLPPGTDPIGPDTPRAERMKILANLQKVQYGPGIGPADLARAQNAQVGTSGTGGKTSDLQITTERWGYWLASLSVKSSMAGPKKKSRSRRGRKKQAAGPSGPPKANFIWQAGIRTAPSGQLREPGAGHDLRGLTAFFRALKGYYVKDDVKNEEVVQIKMPKASYLRFKNCLESEGLGWTLNMTTQVTLGEQDEQPTETKGRKSKGKGR